MVSFLKRFTKIKSSGELSEVQQLFFLKRLYRLLDNGYSFLAALEVMGWDARLEPTAKVIIQSLKSGKHIDTAFEIASFHDSIISYLYFVRFNGDIQASIYKCIHMFEHRTKHISKFKQVIRYPIVLCILFIILLFFMKTSVLPSFIDIFQASPESSNTILISITVIDIVTTITIALFIGIIIGGLFWKFYKSNFSIDKQLIIYERIPVYAGFIRLQTSYYFATHIGMFLKTGMSMKDVITQMANQNKLPILAYYAELMLIELQNGHYFNQLLEQLPFIERQLASIFQKNNNTDGLEQDLGVYAEFLTETIEQKIMRILTLIQPIVFTILAFMIIFIYLTLMWPMFQLIKTV